MTLDQDFEVAIFFDIEYLRNDTRERERGRERERANVNRKSSCALSNGDKTIPNISSGTIFGDLD